MLTASASGRSAELPCFRILLEDEGIYAIAYEELRAAGLPAAEIDSDRLALRHRDTPKPLWIEDGGDGRFGPGDHLELLGERLAGEHSYHHPHADLNVYRLCFPGKKSPLTPWSGAPFFKGEEPEAAASRMGNALTSRWHFEEDLLRRYVPRSEGTVPDAWYWAQLSHLEREPFRLSLDPDPAAGGAVSLAVELRGLSSPKAATELHGEDGFSDHRVDVYVNGQRVGSAEWNGQERQRIEIPTVPAAALRPGADEVALKVPRRWLEEGVEAIIDLVLLDWIEVRLPDRGRLGDRQARFELAAQPGQRLVLTTRRGAGLAVYTPTGVRIGPDRMERRETADETTHAFAAPADSPVLYAVPHGSHLTAAAIERQRPSELRDTSRQADYLMIVHPRLRQAIEPLAAFHRERGLTVEVVDVREVYDAFNHGIVDPRAIRDLIAHAVRQWRPPAPRFVLLVGDASWNGKNLPGAGAEHRNLIPTGYADCHRHYAASDNGFVTLGAADGLPELAIGRLPLAEPTDVVAVVEKIVRYVRAAPVGPWRREILWISSEDPSYVRGTARLARAAAGRGFDSRELLPHAGQANEVHRLELRQALARGPLLVHFLGHGARGLWRTGTPDWQKETDLFTVDDLDLLPPRPNLPMVLSMTCATAPFDSPTEGSLGEKLLRLPDRGAVAVLAASWLNTPSPEASRALIEELTHPGTTIGEAILRSKRRVHGDRHFVETYNLLGDPALELHLPKLKVTIEAAPDGSGIVATVPRAGFAGRAIVDWLDRSDRLLTSRQLPVEGAALRASRPADAASPAKVRVYVWNEDEAIDGIGALALDQAPISPDSKPSAKSVVSRRRP